MADGVISQFGESLQAALHPVVVGATITGSLARANVSWKCRLKSLAVWQLREIVEKYRVK